MDDEKEILDLKNSDAQKDLSISKEKFNLHVGYWDNFAFLGQNDEIINNQISNILHLFAEKYSPNDLNFFIINTNKSTAFDSVCNLPHTSDMVTDFEDLPLTFQLLRDELRNRQNTQNKIPILFVVITDIQHIIDEKLFFEIPELVRMTRYLNVHFLLSAPESASELFRIFYTVQKIDLDKEHFIMEEVVNSNFSEVHQVESKLKQFQKNWIIHSNTGDKKTLKLIHGDMCELQRKCDIVVVSAFKNDYAPVNGSLIDSLERKKYFWVELLARNPELSIKDAGCWLSRDTGTDFKRVACIELLDNCQEITDSQKDIILKKSFSTFRYLIEQAEISGIPSATIALPIIGSGYQGIELEYIIPTLAMQCRSILQSINEVQSINIYEPNYEKFMAASKILDSIFTTQKHVDAPKVFLSYSSKQLEIANEIRELLEKNHISCWMAPYSIPAGSDYQETIPIALSQINVLVLLLTPEVKQSRWVQKEVGTAIGSDKELIPYQVMDFDLDERFRFLLDGEQILFNYISSQNKEHTCLIEQIKSIISNNEH